jgi:protein-S-isoprenylcysteine O-methyltransferase Ste14
LTILGISLLRIAMCLGLLARWTYLELLRRAAPVPAPRPFRVRVAKLGKEAVKWFLAVQTLFLSFWPIADDPGALQGAGAAVFFLALLLSWVARHQLGPNWVDQEEATVRPGHQLVSHGLYRYIRHPIYTADLLLFVGLQLALNCWLVAAALVLVPVMVARTAREEVQLSSAVPGYAEYRLRTKRFIPFIV